MVCTVHWARHRTRQHGSDVQTGKIKIYYSSKQKLNAVDGGWYSFCFSIRKSAHKKSSARQRRCYRMSVSCRPAWVCVCVSVSVVVVRWKSIRIECSHHTGFEIEFIVLFFPVVEMENRRDSKDFFFVVVEMPRSQTTYVFCRPQPLRKTMHAIMRSIKNIAGRRALEMKMALFTYADDELMAQRWWWWWLLLAWDKMREIPIVNLQVFHQSHHETWDRR